MSPLFYAVGASCSILFCSMLSLSPLYAALKLEMPSEAFLHGKRRYLSCHQLALNAADCSTMDNRHVSCRVLARKEASLRDY